MLLAPGRQHPEFQAVFGQFYAAKAIGREIGSRVGWDALHLIKNIGGMISTVLKTAPLQVYDDPTSATGLCRSAIAARMTTRCRITSSMAVLTRSSHSSPTRGRSKRSRVGGWPSAKRQM